MFSFDPPAPPEQKGRMSQRAHPTAESETTAPVMRLRGRDLVLDGRPKMVGILNVTPDSFYDGGQHQGLAAALAHARQMIDEGAAMLDIGGESTRPGHTEVPAAEEIARVVPVIEVLSATVSIPLSIDTSKAEVARAAVAAGAHLINDVHGFQRDPELARLAAEYGCGVILMHQDATFRDTAIDPVAGVAAFLERSAGIALAAGVPRSNIILDPGIGFAKTHAQNLALLARLGEFRSLGFPLLLGASRKSVIGNVLSLPPDERLEGTLATTTLAAWQDVEFIRVHDVRANLRAALMAAALRTARSPSP